MLNHGEKTYFRQRAMKAPEARLTQPSTSAAWEPGKWEGKPAELFRWTNGPERGCLWLVSATQFGGNPGKPFTPSLARSQVTPDLPVGTFVGTNSILSATERIMVSPAFTIPTAVGTASGGTSQLVTFHSTLISITPTNFHPSEFEIPVDYKEIASEVQTPFQARPSIFGSRLNGWNNQAGLQKGLEQGRPLLPPPIGIPKNQ